MSEENKCENCGGEGLIHQGESIKFTCSSCSGTGKSINVPLDEESPIVAEDSDGVEAEESFLEDSSGDLDEPSEDVL